MKLEVGKTYRNRLGNKIHIVNLASWSQSNCDYIGNDGCCYTTEGSFNNDRSESVYDLVSLADVETESSEMSTIMNKGPVKDQYSVLSFRDQLARDLLVADMASGSEPVNSGVIVACFKLADEFIAEAKRRG